MATLKGQTIAASYQDLVKRADTYSQTGTNIEIMNDSAVVQPTGLYLESGATTDNVGIGVAAPADLLHISASAVSSRSDNGNTVVIIERSDHAYLQISTNDGSTGGLIMGDDGDSFRGGITYNHSTEATEIRAVGSTKLKLDTNSRISLSNNDSGGTGGSDSTSGNTIFGYLAGTAVASGGLNNVLIGHKAGTAVSTGDENIAIGNNAGATIDTGLNNVIMGTGAGDAFDAERDNVFIGHQCADGAINGADYCVVIGSEAFKGAATQDGTVAIGYQALTALTSGNKNTALGYETLNALTDSHANTALGYNAMKGANQSNIHNNVAIGANAMDGIGTGDGPAWNVAIGVDALGGALTSDGNVGIGQAALTALTSGSGNVGIGYFAGYLTVGGANNVSLGYEAHKTNISGNNNIAIGYRAMYDHDAGTTSQDSDANVAIGSNAMGGAWVNAKSEANVAIGYGAMSAALNAASENVAIGFNALVGCIEGHNNVAIGYAAGEAIQDGGLNVVIGYDSETSGVDTDNEIVIGSSTTGLAANSVVLGNASVTAVYAAQDAGAVVYCGGVNFPDDATAGVADVNTLDAYEEGTWTAGLNGDSATALTLNVTSGFYTKIGNVVHCTAEIRVTSLNSASGTAHLTGLPFTSKALGGANLGKGPAGGIINLAENLNITAGQNITISVEAGASIAYLKLWDADAGMTALSPAEISADGELYIQLSYLT